MESPIRLSDLKAGTFRTITSRKGFKKALTKGLITLDGKICHTGDYIKGGELIEIFRNEASGKPLIHIPLSVLYEDHHLAIVNKPPGLVVSGNRKWTLENALPAALQKSIKPDALKRPEPIHRLDMPTSGAVLIGKTSTSVQQLNTLFAERQIDKTYHAVTIKSMEDRGSISHEIDGKSALTKYQVLQSVVSPKYEFLNFVKLSPHTGRKHQLRKHLAALGNPILGDHEYGVAELSLKGKGLYLHASTLQFVHPFTHAQISITAPLPKKYLKIFPVH